MYVLCAQKGIIRRVEEVPSSEAIDRRQVVTARILEG
jgi:hypothetical protein